MCLGKLEPVILGTRPTCLCKKTLVFFFPAEDGFGTLCSIRVALRAVPASSAVPCGALRVPSIAPGPTGSTGTHAAGQCCTWVRSGALPQSRCRLCSSVHVPAALSQLFSLQPGGWQKHPRPRSGDGGWRGELGAPAPLRFAVCPSLPAPLWLCGAQSFGPCHQCQPLKISVLRTKPPASRGPADAHSPSARAARCKPLPPQQKRGRVLPWGGSACPWP